MPVLNLNIIHPAYELQSNKVVDFSAPDNITFVTSLGVKTYVDAAVGAISVDLNSVLTAGNTSLLDMSVGTVFTSGVKSSGGYYFNSSTPGLYHQLTAVAPGTLAWSLPGMSGTIALTSNLSNYLPLAGGTMTGSILVDATNSYDLGTIGAAFRSGYFGTEVSTSALTATGLITGGASIKFNATISGGNPFGNSFYTTGTNSMLGFIVAGGIGSYQASAGPYNISFGNTYSALGGLRGTMIFSAGSPAGPVDGEGDIFFRTGADLDRLHIHRNGNVGINTAIPLYKLHLTTATNDGTVAYSINNSTKRVIEFTDRGYIFGYAYNSVNPMYELGYTGSFEAGSLKLYAAGGANGILLAGAVGVANYINNSLGINTTSPNVSFEVRNGGVDMYNLLRFRNSTGTLNTGYIQSDAGGMGYVTVSGVHHFNGGNVAIGTTGSVYQLLIYSTTGGGNSGLQVQNTAASSYANFGFNGNNSQVAETGATFVNGGLIGNTFGHFTNCSNGISLIAYNGTGVIKFFTGGLAAADMRMLISATGVTTFTPATLTGALATSAVEITQTWNATGTPTAFKITITDTASNAASLFADFRTAAGGSMINFSKTGYINAVGYKVGGTSGVSGTWTTVDGKTITATNGIITSIV